MIPFSLVQLERKKLRFGNEFCDVSSWFQVWRLTCSKVPWWELFALKKVIQSLIDSIHCKSNRLPIMYLGLQFQAKQRMTTLWSPMIVKLEKKLSLRKRLFFLCVLEWGELLWSILMWPASQFIVSLFKLPKSIEAKLDWIKRNFLWEGGKWKKEDSSHEIVWGNQS